MTAFMLDVWYLARLLIAGYVIVRVLPWLILPLVDAALGEPVEEER